MWKIVKDSEWNSKCYWAGTDRHEAQNLVDRLNSAHIPNVSVKVDGLYVCWYHHEKGDGCNYVREIAIAGEHSSKDIYIDYRLG